MQALSPFGDYVSAFRGIILLERYPPLGEEGLTTKDIEKDLQEARKFIKALFG